MFLHKFNIKANIKRVIYPLLQNKTFFSSKTNIKIENEKFNINAISSIKLLSAYILALVDINANNGIKLLTDNDGYIQSKLNGTMPTSLFKIKFYKNYSFILNINGIDFYSESVCFKIDNIKVHLKGEFIEISYKKFSFEMEYGNIEITDNKIICDNIKIFIFDDKVRIEINDFDVEHKAKTITKFSISEKNVIAYSDYEATFYIKK